jgi:hypothetical protein
MIVDLIKAGSVLFIGDKIFEFMKHQHNLQKLNNEKLVNEDGDVGNGKLTNPLSQYYQLMQRDKSVVEDPLIAPERRLEIDKSGNYPLIINERTRGDPDSYQIVGILYNENSNKNYQLFGRRTYPGSNEWEYYIRGKDIGGLDFKFPLNTNQEIYDEATIDIPLDNTIYTVKIYDYDKPRYIPYV